MSTPSAADHINVRVRVACACIGAAVQRRIDLRYPFEDITVDVIIDDRERLLYPYDMADSLETSGMDIVEEICLRGVLDENFYLEHLVGHQVRVVENGANAGDGDEDDVYVGETGALVGWDGGLLDVEFWSGDFEGFCGFQLSIIACPSDVAG